MANRVASKAKKQTKRAPAKPAKGKGEASRSRGTTGRLEADCERLKADLEAAAQRIAALEAQQKQLLDRIDWAIDSLKSLREV